MGNTSHCWYINGEVHLQRNGRTPTILGMFFRIPPCILVCLQCVSCQKQARPSKDSSTGTREDDSPSLHLCYLRHVMYIYIYHDTCMHTLHDSTLHYITWQYITLHYMTVYCIAVHYIKYMHIYIYIPIYIYIYTHTLYIYIYMQNIL